MFLLTTKFINILWLVIIIITIIFSITFSILITLVKNINIVIPSKCWTIINISINSFLFFILSNSEDFLLIQTKNESFSIFNPLIICIPTFYCSSSKSISKFIFNKCYCFSFIITHFMKFLSTKLMFRCFKKQF